MQKFTQYTQKQVKDQQKGKIPLPREKEIPDLLLLRWSMPYRHQGWTGREALNYFGTDVWSVGWLIHEDERTITISANWEQGGDHQVADAQTVPKSAIVKQITLIPQEVGPFVCEDLKRLIEYLKQESED